MRWILRLVDHVWQSNHGERTDTEHQVIHHLNPRKQHVRSNCNNRVLLTGI